MSVKCHCCVRPYSSDFCLRPTCTHLCTHTAQTAYFFKCPLQCVQSSSDIIASIIKHLSRISAVFNGVEHIVSSDQMGFVFCLLCPSLTRAFLPPSSWCTYSPGRRGCGLQRYSAVLDHAAWHQQHWGIHHQVISGSFYCYYMITLFKSFFMCMWSFELFKQLKVPKHRKCRVTNECL